MIFTATFYSFKGGVGRTAALVNVAAQLAADGRTVALIDMDLEAPGIPMWLPPPKDRESGDGLLELIERSVAEGALPKELDPYVYEPLSGSASGTGRILVIRSGRLDSSYPQRLANLDWSSFFSALDGEGFFRELKNQLHEVYGVDRILIDARTGFSDPGAIAVRSLADLVVLLFRPDFQNLAGLARVLEDIRSDRPDLDDPGTRYLLVASPLLPAAPGSDRERSQRQTLAEAADRLQLLGSRASADEATDQSSIPAEDWQDASEALFAKIRWHAELAEASRPVVQRGSVTPLSLDYVELAKRIEERRTRLGPTSVTDASGDGWSSAARTRIIAEDIGSDEGTTDPRLFERFVSTDVVRQALLPETAFVFGSKGAGKSAIFRFIQEQPDRAFKELPPEDRPRVIPVHGDVEGLVKVGTADLPPDEADESEYEKFWLSYLGARLASYAEADEGSSAISSDSHSALVERMARIRQANTSSSFEDAAKRALARAKSPILLLVDATERLFGDKPLSQAPSFRGLARAWLNWRSALPRLYFKAFIRDQALLDRSGTLVDRSHLQGRSVLLKWEEPDVWWFLLRRLLGGLAEAIVQDGNAESIQIPAVISHDFLSGLLEEEKPNLELSDMRSVLERIFPEKVYPGENEAPFHRWILSRIQDGNGAVYPRALLSFARECQRLDRQPSPATPQRTVFDAVTVREAFREASKGHAENVFAELGYLKPYLEVFGKRPFDSWQLRFTEDEIRKAFEGAHDASGSPIDAETALKVLQALGILRYDPGSRWQGSSFDYSIPSLYKFGLLTPKGRV